MTLNGENFRASIRNARKIRMHGWLPEDAMTRPVFRPPDTVAARVFTAAIPQARDATSADCYRERQLFTAE